MSVSMWVKLAQSETPNIVLMELKASNLKFLVECTDDVIEGQKIIFQVTDKFNGYIHDQTSVVSSLFFEK